MNLSQQFSLDLGVRDSGDLVQEDLDTGESTLVTESGEDCGVYMALYSLLVRTFLG